MKLLTGAEPHSHTLNQRSAVAHFIPDLLVEFPRCWAPCTSVNCATAAKLKNPIFKDQ